MIWIVKKSGPYPYLGTTEPLDSYCKHQRDALRFSTRRGATLASKTYAAASALCGTVRVVKLVPRIRRGKVTRSRSFGFNTGSENEVRWMPGTFAAGVYEVWCRGDRIAIVTDRWMADMIHSGLP